MEGAVGFGGVIDVFLVIVYFILYIEIEVSCSIGQLCFIFIFISIINVCLLLLLLRFLSRRSFPCGSLVHLQLFVSNGSKGNDVHTHRNFKTSVVDREKKL